MLLLVAKLVEVYLFIVQLNYSPKQFILVFLGFQKEVSAPQDWAGQQFILDWGVNQAHEASTPP